MMKRPSAISVTVAVLALILLSIATLITVMSFDDNETERDRIIIDSDIEYTRDFAE